MVYCTVRPYQAAARPFGAELVMDAQGPNSDLPNGQAVALPLVRYRSARRSALPHLPHPAWLAEGTGHRAPLL